MKNPKVYPTLPAVDLERAVKFYTDKLGFKKVHEDASPGAALAIDGSAALYLYRRGATKADHTVAVLEVQDFEATMQELKARGVKFEDYDLPGLKTVNGVAAMKASSDREIKTAWFKDTEGNILGLSSPMLR